MYINTVKMKAIMSGIHFRQLAMQLRVFCCSFYESNLKSYPPFTCSGSSYEMEERIHVTRCQNKVQREITFIFPNYIYEPIFLEQAKFCIGNPLIETTIKTLYDIVTNPKKEAHKSWKEKLSESLMLTNTDLPYITNQGSHNSELNKQDIAQQTEISCLNAKENNDKALQKSSFSDLSRNCSSPNFTTSSCLSCAGFDSAAGCFQPANQQRLETIIRARTASVAAPRQSSTSSLHAEKANNMAELSVEEQVEAEKLWDDLAGQEDNEDIYEDDTFNQTDIRSVTNDFINTHEPMPFSGFLSDKDSTHLLDAENSTSINSVFAAGEENKRRSEETLHIVEEADEA